MSEEHRADTAEASGQRKDGPRIGRKAALVAVLTALGMGLGFARDLLIARFFGATADTDAFMIAWTVPETVTPLIMEGAMLYALVPLFGRALERDGTLRPTVARSAAPVTMLLAAVAVALALLAPAVVPVLAPGLAEPELAIQGFRITAATVVFLGLAGYCTAILHSHYAFGAGAAVYLAYNVGIIACILTLRPAFGVLSAAIGLVVGGVLMVAIQLPSVIRRVGLPRPSVRISRSLLSAMAPAVPVMLFLLIRHAQVYVERFFGSFLDPGAISHLNYAQKVAQVPVVLVFSVAVVSFPALARGAAASQRAELRRLVDRNLHVATALIAPAIVALVVYAPQTIELLFERGAFEAQDSATTSGVMRVYVLGRLGQALVNIAALPMFVFAQHVRLPLRAGALGLAVTIVVDAALLPLGHAAGLAAGNAAGICVMAWVLLRDLRGRVLPVDLRGLRRQIGMAVALSAAAGAVGYLVTSLAPLPTEAVPFVGGLVIVIVYGLAAHLLGVVDVGALFGSPRHTRRSKEASA